MVIRHVFLPAYGALRGIGRRYHAVFGAELFYAYIALLIAVTGYGQMDSYKHIGPEILIIQLDGGTGQLTAQLGEWLGMRHLHNALSLKLKDEHLEVVTAADKQLCTWKCALPAVVSVNRGINKPGPVPVRNIIMAARKELCVWSADDLDGLDRSLIGLKNSPTQNGELYPLETGRAGVMVEGSADELAASILEKIASAGIQL